MPEEQTTKDTKISFKMNDESLSMELHIAPGSKAMDMFAQLMIQICSDNFKNLIIDRLISMAEEEVFSEEHKRLFLDIVDVVTEGKNDLVVREDIPSEY